LSQPPSDGGEGAGEHGGDCPGTSQTIEVVLADAGYISEKNPRGRGILPLAIS